MKKFILRLIWIPISAYLLILVIRLTNFPYLFLSYNETNEEKIIYCLLFVELFFFIWILNHFVFEIIAFAKPNFNRKYWLRHLRFAPLVILIFSSIIISVFDAAMIQFSKYELKQYIYQNNQSIEVPNLLLHNDYRGFCGNGASAYAKHLYYEIASSGLNDENPYVRSRSLLASNEVKDGINGDYQFENDLSKSCKDDSLLVRLSAESILKTRNSSCFKQFIEK